MTVPRLAAAWLPAGPILALLLLPLAAADAAMPASEQLPRCGDAEVGAEAPWLAGWTLDEEIFNLTKPFADEGVQRLALVFWATWCQPCREGLMRLAEAAERLEAAGVAVALVNVGEEAPTVASFLQRTPLPFPVVLDPYRNCLDTYLTRPGGLTVLPLTVVLDRERRVVRIIGAEGDDYVELLLDHEEDAP
jgi:thiol-disulfide isomerase/thioredoxin